MAREEDKQSSHKTPYTELEQVNFDFILAMSMQEQDGTLETIESQSDDEDMSDSSFENDDDDSDSDFSESQEFETEPHQFVEGEGSNYDEEMEIEEDEIDPDELSYEQLIELGEIIGEEKRGLSADEISSCLYPYTCQQSAESKSGIDRCVVCQVEYEEGEIVVALQCKHPFHADCVSTWLQIKKICPICSNEVSTPKRANNP